MSNQKIIIIQNTDYHFETVLSLYQMLKNLGLDPQVYRCSNIENKFNQIYFLNKYDIPIISPKNIDSNMIGVVVSTYPNPQVSIKNAVPNNNDFIFSVLDKIIYISHRFKNSNDYDGIINRNNVLCLSPLSKKIDVNYLYLTDIPVVPNHSFDNEKIRLTVQGHFELAGRNGFLFKNIIHIISKVNKNIVINVLGTNTTNIIKYLQDMGALNCDIKSYDSLDENDFYNVINNDTDWLVPLITPELNNSTYSLERYSSNFNLATSLRKLIFCHEHFQNIYNIPGIYFNDTNLEESLIGCLTIDSKQYDSLLQEFDLLIPRLRYHNESILMKKISYFN